MTATVQTPSRILLTRLLDNPDDIASIPDIISTFYLGASVNVMPKSMFQHLKLANLKEINMLVEMADMIRKSLLEIVENIMNFSLGIREDRVLFDMDGAMYHSEIPIEKVYMANSIQEEESFNLLEIGDDLFSYESPACLLFKQYTRFCNDESIDTLDSSDSMQEPKVKHKNVMNLEKITLRWHVLDTMLFMEKGNMECSNNGCASGIMKDKVLEEIREFDNEIEQLANEYNLRMGKKGYALDDVWENAKNSMAVHYTHGTMTDSRKKSDKRVLDDALPLGRANRSRFMGTIRKEIDEEGGSHNKEMEFEVTSARIHVVKMLLFRRNHSSYAVTNIDMA
ncbi:hypothetical protein Tco_1345997 [Tanacetum coccineum]